MKTGERIDTLTRLGLTVNQARAYLTLVQFGPAIAKEISERSKITRQDVYRVMPELEKSGLVQTRIERPTIYKGIPVEQAMAILLKRHAEEQRDLRKKTKQLIFDLNSDRLEHNVRESDVAFTMVHGRDVIVKRLGEKLRQVEHSLDVVTSAIRFSPAIIEFADGYKASLKRGVKIRIAVEGNCADNSTSEIVKSLVKCEGFNVRHFEGAPEAVVSIFDHREASVTLSSVASMGRACALWSNEASFVALARNYFRNTWKNSRKLDFKPISQVHKF